MIKILEKSKIWHDAEEVPKKQFVGIYLLSSNLNIVRIIYDENKLPWSCVGAYCGGEFVAWAYARELVNL